ncbi:MMPL family transporter [Lysinibacillus louembei]|uniref:MMPL family transporter n=1 Tax=Lysinibacillus louembei TaxID=1470088 RepID=A0ABZ0RSJ2_9BACI|nr:MMPL family transporter [Lysinibacillus louembei]WPK11100.1 MMPL family transporter [Lysinibacillus louembei]
MSKLKNWRTLSFALWTLVTAIVLITMPDMDRLIKEKGQIAIPETEQSAIAYEMLQEMDPKGGEAYSIIAVFNSGNEEALSTEQRQQVADVVKELQSKKQQLGITEMVSHLDGEEIEKQLVAEDGTTILTQLSVTREQGSITEVAEALHSIIDSSALQTYLTGSELVGTDFMNSTQEGVQKTEIIAVIFILAVLVLVFRSPIVPVISLLTVGVSYLVSMGVIAQLVDQFNFPFSNFTQVFLVVVLFGIGTDYNILLYTRFKEELSSQDNAFLATKATFKFAGKTVVYSGIAVLIGFASLILANFKLYQATSAVAIGVAVLLLVLMTLNPFFMVLLGKKMFYPVKTFKGHGDSRLWGFLAKSAAFRPFFAVILVLVISIPFIMSYSNTLNFNDLWEVDDKYESKQGINVIEKHFSPGFSSPATLVLQAEQPLDDVSSLQILDELADKISKIDGVSEVYAPTRPAGEKIKELYINDQANELKAGLGDANSGIGTIHEGLASANEQMAGGDTNDLANVQQLIDGTSEVKNGVAALNNALNDLTAGLTNGTTGAQQLANGLTSLNNNIQALSNATAQLHTAYNQLENGLASYNQHFTSIAQAIDGAAAGYQQIEALMTSLLETKPELTEDANIQQTLGIAKSAQQQLQELASQVQQLAGQHQMAMTSFKKANGALGEVNTGLDQMKTGVAHLQQGANELTNGFQKGADGSQQIASNTGQLQQGVAQIHQGQQQLLTGLQDLQEQMGQLQAGLTESTEGLAQVSDGLQQSQDYLSDLSTAKSSEKFYVPQDILVSEDFQEALNMYMSDNRQFATMTIILETNPYSQQAMPIVQEIKQQVATALEGTSLQDTKAAIGGKSSENVDLKNVSEQDFLHTATIMLIGIALVLMVITRSIAHSIFIVGSLLLAYFTALGASELISSYVLNIDQLSWNVPFFSFIMIVALGVDYSIFLMMRYNELEDNPTEQIVQASRHIGGVVLSAALILGGTFAALIPSGVLTLIQVALVVLIGLVFLSFIAMPVLLPGLIGLMNKVKGFTKK